MNRPFRSLGLAALLSVTAACDDTVVQPTFGAGCSVGSLSAGADVLGQFKREACVIDYEGYSGNTVNYVSYEVSLTRGKGYHFFASLIPQGSEAASGSTILTLWGRNAQGQSVPLAMSAGDAGGPLGASEVFFIAPRSGTFRLVVSNYEISDVGDYRVTMNECPVLGTLDTAGTYTFTHRGSSCVRRNLGYFGVTSEVVLVGIKPQANLEHQAMVSSDAFTPYFEMGGPGFDTFGYFGLGVGYDSEWGSGNYVFGTVPADTAGTLTLVVGSDILDPRGQFRVNLLRIGATLMDSPAALRAAAWNRRSTLNQRNTQ